MELSFNFPMEEILMWGFYNANGYHRPPPPPTARQKQEKQRQDLFKELRDDWKLRPGNCEKGYLEECLEYVRKSYANESPAFVEALLHDARKTAKRLWHDAKGQQQNGLLPTRLRYIAAF